MTEIISILLAFSAKIGYLGIVLLMAIESSFIPFPSEIVIPPAAYLASQGQFNVYLVIIAGIVGSLIGAIINYFLASTLGRHMVYALVNKKFAKFLLLSEQKIKYAEEYFLKYGNISTFLGRLVPAVRQLISVPAGFSKMKLKNFIIFTALGSGLWTIILAVVGYVFGANQDLFFSYYHSFKIAIYGLVGMITAVGAFFWIRIIIKNKKNNNTVKDA